MEEALPQNVSAATSLSAPILSFRDWWFHSEEQDDDNDDDRSDISNHEEEDEQGINNGKRRRYCRSKLLLDIRNLEEQPTALRFLDNRNTKQQQLQQQDDDVDNNSNGETIRTLTVVNIPFGTALQERSYELPPRHVAFALLLDCTNTTNNTEQVRAFFRGKPMSRQRPWKVTALLDATSLVETWHQAIALGLQVGHDDDNNDDTSFTTTECIKTTRPLFPPLPRLWQPDGMVEDVLLPLLKEQLRCNLQLSSNSSSSSSPITLNEIWDLGAGAGRDVCFLAEELKHDYYYNQLQQLDSDERNKAALSEPPFCVVALDQRYRQQQQQQEKRNEAWELLQRRKVADVSRCQYINLTDIAAVVSLINKSNRKNSTLPQQQLEDDGSPESNSTSNTVGGNKQQRRVVMCLFAVRYWNRPLVERIAQSASALSSSSSSSSSSSNTGDDHVLYLPEGTIFAMSTFGKPHIGAVWNHEHPREKHVLERNELEEMFTSSSSGSSSAADNNDNDCCYWDILHNKVVRDSDHGRTLIQFVAQKKKPDR